jgi:hypothetical protein
MLKYKQEILLPIYGSPSAHEVINSQTWKFASVVMEKSYVYWCPKIRGTTQWGNANSC